MTEANLLPRLSPVAEAVAHFRATPAPVAPSPQQAMQAKVAGLEEIILRAEQTDLQTAHEVIGEVYARTIFIPAGTVLTGAAHNKDHVNVMHGDIEVSTDEGMRRLTGYHVLPTKAGMKRVGFAHADTYWTTICHTKLTDIEAIEDEMTPESAKLQSRTLHLQHTKTQALEVQP